MDTPIERNVIEKGGKKAEGSPSRTMRDSPGAPADDKTKRMSEHRDGMTEYAADYVEEKPAVKSQETSKDIKGVPLAGAASGSRISAAQLSRKSLKDPDGSAAPSSPATKGSKDPAMESDPLVLPRDKSKGFPTKSQEPCRQNIIRNETSRKTGLEHTSVPNIPDTNIAVACLVTLCFNLPLGAVAIYFSLMAAKAYRDGQTKKGAKRTRISIYISLFSIVLTVLIVMAVVLLMTMKGQTGQPRRRLSKTTIVL